MGSSGGLREGEAMTLGLLGRLTKAEQAVERSDGPSFYVLDIDGAGQPIRAWLLDAAGGWVPRAVSVANVPSNASLIKVLGAPVSFADL
jgi:hypothetical protein